MAGAYLEIVASSQRLTNKLANAKARYLISSTPSRFSSRVDKLESYRAVLLGRQDHLLQVGFDCHRELDASGAVVDAQPKDDETAAVGRWLCAQDDRLSDMVNVYISDEEGAPEPSIPEELTLPQDRFLDSLRQNLPAAAAARVVVSDWARVDFHLRRLDLLGQSFGNLSFMLFG